LCLTNDSRALVDSEEVLVDLLEESAVVVPILCQEGPF
jgi:hypothetical protein